MTLNGGKELSFNQKAAVILGLLTFVGASIDALNGFAGLAAVQPFATKGYVTEAMQAQYEKTAATEAEINSRLSNIQMMSLEMSLQLIDGQMSTRRGEQVDLQVKLVERPNDLLVKKRLVEVQANIDELIARRNLLACYLDVLRGFKRDCR